MDYFSQEDATLSGAVSLIAPQAILPWEAVVFEGMFGGLAKAAE